MGDDESLFTFIWDGGSSASADGMGRIIRLWAPFWALFSISFDIEWDRMDDVWLVGFFVYIDLLTELVELKCDMDVEFVDICDRLFMVA